MRVWGLVSFGGLKGGLECVWMDTFTLPYPGWLLQIAYHKCNHVFFIVLWSPDNGWLGLGRGSHSLLNVLLIF